MKNIILPIGVGLIILKSASLITLQWYIIIPIFVVGLVRFEIIEKNKSENVKKITFSERLEMLKRKKENENLRKY